MATVQQILMHEILMFTGRIMDESPELYSLLHETPLFFSHNEKEISVEDYEQYLESLKSQFTAFRQPCVFY